MSGARISEGTGAINVATGVPVLDHLLTELARAGGFDLTLEIEPDDAEAEVDAAGTALYVDDALSMSSLDANMSLLDPGGACRSVTPSAAGPFTISVEGVGVTASAEFEAVAATE